MQTPLVEPGLLRHGPFAGAAIGSFVLGAGIIGMTSFVPTLAQSALGASLWPASLLVLAWAGAGVASALTVRHLPFPVEGLRAIALLLVVVAAGQLLAFGVSATSSPWRLLPSMLLAGVATGGLNALLGREAVSSVPPDRAAMGSGANNTARYVGAACGITVFVTVATHSGSGLVAGWNTAVLVSAAITLLGALGVAIEGSRPT